MRLVVTLKLLPSRQQAALLSDTLRQANAAANVISALAWRERVFGQFTLHKLVYAQIRQRFPLSAQVIVRLIAKVADAYKGDCLQLRRFRPRGSITYDDRILRFGSDHVSIWTTAGRQSIPFVCGARQRGLVAFRQGESDLVFRSGLCRLWDYADPCGVSSRLADGSGRVVPQEVGIITGSRGRQGLGPGAGSGRVRLTPVQYGPRPAL